MKLNDLIHKFRMSVNLNYAEKYSQYLYELSILQALKHKRINTTFKEWCDIKGNKKHLWLK